MAGATGQGPKPPSGCSKRPPGPRPIFLGLGLAGDSHCCDLPGGMRRILSPARPSRLATGSDDPTSRSHLGWEPMPRQPLKHGPSAASGSRGACREPGRTANPRAGAGSSCPAMVGAPRRGGEACKVGRASVEAGEVGDLQIPEESAFPVPSSFPPTWT